MKLSQNGRWPDIGRPEAGVGVGQHRRQWLPRRKNAEET